MSDPRLAANSNPSSPLQKLAADGWKWTLGLGIVAILVGILTLVWPGLTVLALAIFFGAYLVVTGIGQIIGGFAPHLAGAARVLYVVSGVLSLVLGFVCLRDELQSIVLLGVWIGVGWFMTGIARVVGALDAPDVPGRGWAIVAGIVVTLGGVTLLVSPFSSLLALAVVTGCFLLAAGIAQIVEALQLRRAVSARAINA